ncbi:ZIP zinc transporter domain-containing protein [Ditylenchus destructor]|nr:ZIP zinc transporter domain-containing protein [Ditylenchus destructor]
MSMALQAGLLAAAATAFGSLPALGTRSLSVALAVLLGAWALMALDRWLPHEHFIKGREGIEAHRLRRTWLFVFAITLHNLPEGLAIGVAFAANDPVAAASLSLAIAIQDLPEGFVIAVALMNVGYSRRKALLLGAASGLVEPIGAVLGAWVVSEWPPLLPWGLGFAAGAMLFAVLRLAWQRVRAPELAGFLQRAVEGVAIHHAQPGETVRRRAQRPVGVLQQRPAIPEVAQPAEGRRVEGLPQRASADGTPTGCRRTARSASSSRRTAPGSGRCAAGRRR